jgi:hypothetical protein
MLTWEDDVEVPLVELIAGTPTSIDIEEGNAEPHTGQKPTCGQTANRELTGRNVDSGFSRPKRFGGCGLVGM